ncbi:MAG: hypothetical protein ABFS12_14700 [Bacteroidota bacterium]
MKIDWNDYLNKTINITMKENYGVVYNSKGDDQPEFYEIVFKTGKLEKVFDDGLLLEADRDNQKYNIFVPYESIKCVEMF